MIHWNPTSKNEFWITKLLDYILNCDITLLSDIINDIRQIFGYKTVQPSTCNCIGLHNALPPPKKIKTTTLWMLSYEIECRAALCRISSRRSSYRFTFEIMTCGGEHLSFGLRDFIHWCTKREVEVEEARFQEAFVGVTLIKLALNCKYQNFIKNQSTVLEKNRNRKFFYNNQILKTISRVKR